jgi:hypothetical protein
MATTSYAISSYLIYHNSENNGDLSAVILCSGSTASAQGTLYFYKVGASIPANSKTSSGQLYLRYRESMLAQIVDTLRNESPLTIWFNDTSLQGGLYTGKELVGEGE